MRKEDIASLIVYVAMVVLAVVIGFVVLLPVMNNLASVSMPFNNSFLFAIVTILVAIVFNAILIELGHLLGAKLGGYKIAMFNVLGITFFRKANKIKFGFKGFDGLTGETKIFPYKENSNPKAYLWFPLLFYIIEIGFVVGICTWANGVKDQDLLKSIMWLTAASIMFACIGGIIILYNYVPYRLDSMTDGYKLTLLSKPINKVAYNEMLRIEYDEFEGIASGDTMVFDEITDFTARVNTIKIYSYLAKKDYKKAIDLLTKIVAVPKNISVDTYNISQAQIVSLRLLSGENVKEVEEYYTFLPSYTKKAISEAVSIECDRAYLLVSGLIEDSQGETNYAFGKYSKAIKRSLESRIPVEKELFDLSCERIKARHPDWIIAHSEN